VGSVRPANAAAAAAVVAAGAAAAVAAAGAAAAAASAAAAAAAAAAGAEMAAAAVATAAVARASSGCALAGASAERQECRARVAGPNGWAARAAGCAVPRPPRGPHHSPTQDGAPRSPREFGARLRAGPHRRALGGLSRRPAREMASKARGARCDRQGGKYCGLARCTRDLRDQRLDLRIFLRIPLAGTVQDVGIARELLRQLEALQRRLDTLLRVFQPE
jgi:hypothetical protein